MTDTAAPHRTAAASGRRHYSSELREQQAASTRDKVVRAALACFSATGYERTTLADIAAEAKVSVETVRSHGPKPTLIRAAIECLDPDYQGDVFLASPIGQHYAAQTSLGALLDVAVTVSTEVNRNSWGIWAALGAAAATDPDLEQAFVARLAVSRGEIAEIVDLVIERGWARADRDREELVLRAWITCAPETYERLVRRGGLTEPEYTAWLRRSLEDLVAP
jgi:AcrR family transcriptional regulator